jgi:predicted nucleic acid-binding protein
MEIYKELKQSLYNAFFDDKLRKGLGNFYAVDTNIILEGMEISRDRSFDLDPRIIRTWLRNARVTLYSPIAEEAVLISKDYGAYNDFKKLVNRANIRFVKVPNYSEIQEILFPLSRDLHYNLDINNLSKEDKILIASSFIEGGELVSFDKTINKVALAHNIKIIEKGKNFPRKFRGAWFRRLL